MERGENKNNALDDFNDIKADSKNNYDNLKNILLDQKATPSSLPRLILNNMEEDPVSELEDINRINKGIEDLQLLLQDRLRQQQQELEKLKQFKEDVENGKNKQFMMNDLMKIYLGNMNNIKEAQYQAEKQNIPQKRLSFD